MDQQGQQNQKPDLPLISFPHHPLRYSNTTPQLCTNIPRHTQWQNHQEFLHTNEKYLQKETHQMFRKLSPLFMELATVSVAVNTVSFKIYLIFIWVSVSVCA